MKKNVYTGQRLTDPLIPLDQLWAADPRKAALSIAGYLLEASNELYVAQRQEHAQQLLKLLVTPEVSSALEAGLRAPGLASRIKQLKPGGVLVSWDIWDQAVVAKSLGFIVEEGDVRLMAAHSILTDALICLRDIANTGRAGTVETSDKAADIVVFSRKRQKNATKLNVHGSYEPQVCHFCWRTAERQRAGKSFCAEHAGSRGEADRKRQMRIARKFQISNRAEQLYKNCSQVMDAEALKAASEYECYMRGLSAAGIKALYKTLQHFATLAPEALNDPKRQGERRKFKKVQRLPPPEVPHLPWAEVLKHLPYVRKRAIGSANPVDVLDPIAEDAPAEAAELHRWLRQSPYNALATLCAAEAWLEAQAKMKSQHGGLRGDPKHQ